MPEIYASGIDVSQFNGNLDMNALKGRVDFIIIRCGYGSDYAFQDDTQYRANVDKCLAAGIPFGVYLYSYAKNTEMARSEAAHTLRLLRGLRPLYGVWYDVEDPTLPYGEALVNNCLAYYQAIQQAGYYCGIYASLYWMRNRLNSPRLAHIDRWVAQWAPQLDYPGAGIWQYSDRGQIGGKIFDMNRAYRDYPAIINGEDWTDMTAEQVAQLARKQAQEVYQENEQRYKTIDDVPQWARAAVEEVYTRLGLRGMGSGQDKKLNGSATYVRALYVIWKLLEELDERERIVEELEQKETRQEERLEEAP